MAEHARLGFSHADCWMQCAASVPLSAGFPDMSSAAAEEGTAAHHLAHQCLFYNRRTDFYIGTSITNPSDATFEVDEDMARHVQSYCDYVRTQAGDDLLLLEQRLDISSLTGEKDARGTADAVIITPRTLHIIDLKYGMGVRVHAERNRQLMGYAAAALEAYEDFGDFSHVVLHIVQPRLDHYSVWETVP